MSPKYSSKRVLVSLAAVERGQEGVHALQLERGLHVRGHHGRQVVQPVPAAPAVMEDLRIEKTKMHHFKNMLTNKCFLLYADYLLIYDAMPTVREGMLLCNV